MLKLKKQYSSTLRELLEKINYSLIVQTIRGNGAFLDPWFDLDSAQKAIESIPFAKQNIMKLLYLGTPISKESLLNEISAETLMLLIECGLLIENETMIETANIVILMYQQLYLVVEKPTNHKYTKNSDTDVYIGYDSFRLAENIKFDKGAVVLDLCSGSGIQGLIAGKSAARVISVELNKTAFNFASFNGLLNDLEDTVEVRLGNLYNPVKQDEKFDYIYVNPPFIPVVKNIYYPLCGDGGEDGMHILKKIIEGIPNIAKKSSKVQIFCQCLGDSNSILFLDYLKNFSKNLEWNCNAIVTDKLPLKYQAQQLATFTACVNKELDIEKFIKDMKQIYFDLNVDYLYSLIIDITVGEKGSLKLYNIANSWNLKDIPVSNENIDIRNSNDSYIVQENSEIKGYFDTIAKDIFDLFDGENSLSDISKQLHPKNSERFTEAAFELEVMMNVQSMEKLGLINKKSRVNL
ncbi:methylase of polypeptide subunit release factors [Enterococcus sp. PF1-24]|uniref:methyltransferase n=1 Tax=unclassified Enterococcus TaxID=2608891 RepID=UPI002474A011|nr:MULTISPECIES: methyltransferase [unclassified Enterococcus]MDH6363477.1 methylase of polypeptide subunit release factors [Enterococcus sp. PFB1-1]MDH6400571.1 methylase of polypeptide subunit release factors [Enterococcus sp. PF1-24]